MYVYFDVDERSLLRYMRQRTDSRNTDPGSLRELGIDCYVQLADEKDFPHKGKLDFVESEVNTATGTARLRGVFENKDDALASGLFVRVRVPASQQYQALLIPERALATDQDCEIRLRRRRATALPSGEPWNWVRNAATCASFPTGLKAGEQVIVKGLAASSSWAKG